MKKWKKQKKLYRSCRQLDDKIGIVGLGLCFVCRLVSDGSSAPLTAVCDYVTALGVGLCADGTKYAAAGVLPVAGVYVDVQRA